MATSSPTLLYCSDNDTARISLWLEALPLTAQAEDALSSPKRQRSSSIETAAAMSTHRDASPSKRQRRTSDEPSEQSASDPAGLHTRPLVLGGSNTFNPPSSHDSATTARSNSPSRKSASMSARSGSPALALTTKLTVASPRIYTEIFGTGPQRPRATAINLIKNDADIGLQMYLPGAFSTTATSDLLDPNLTLAARAELEYILRKVKGIHQRAVHCCMRGRDENAWCDEVVRPTIILVNERAGSLSSLGLDVLTKPNELSAQCALASRASLGDRRSLSQLA
ncbi:hypothetical protein A1F94_011552 [Pyrenophora tritici-repentis]|nr:hypothetical protein A1F94_011552 [Pyrenophora tritici-repentis]